MGAVTFRQKSGNGDFNQKAILEIFQHYILETSIGKKKGMIDVFG